MTHNRMFRATTPEENPFVPIGEAVRKALEGLLGKRRNTRRETMTQNATICVGTLGQGI